MNQLCRRGLAIFALLCNLLLPLWTATPVARAQAAEQSFVGRVAGTELFVGIVTDGDQITAYVCDGPDRGIGDLYSGSVADAVDGVLTLTNDENDDELVVFVDPGTLANVMQSAGSLTGVFLTPDRTSFSYDAAPAAGPGAVYRIDDTLADGTEAEGGWVVLNSGDIRGQVHCAPNGSDCTVYQQNGDWFASYRGQRCQFFPDDGLNNFPGWFIYPAEFVVGGPDCPYGDQLPRDPTRTSESMRRGSAPTQSLEVRGQSGQTQNAQVRRLTSNRSGSDHGGSDHSGQ